jgi:hypothetical protein
MFPASFSVTEYPIKDAIDDTEDADVTRAQLNEEPRSNYHVKMSITWYPLGLMAAYQYSWEQGWI